MIRVRQLIPHIIMGSEGEKPSPFPPKVFTERLNPVKYPYSIVKHKLYPHFGLAIEEEVAVALKKVYKDKFVGDIDIKDRKERFKFMNDKDINTYIPALDKYIKGVISYFLQNHPFAKILKISYQQEFSFQDDENFIAGHPDIVVWNDKKEVVIYDVKVFGRTNNNINRDVRIQIASYAAIARHIGLKCDNIGVIMPWNREDAPVKSFDISKWKDAKLISKIIESAPKVLNESYHTSKWVYLLQKYSVGSHVHYKTALEISLRSTPIPIPFQIFLYGNNPSQQMEKNARELIGLTGNKKYKTPDFSKNKIFVHAPYNITLASPAPYIADAIKTYLHDSYMVGAKGVVFHTGHHPDEEEGLKVMKENMKKILPFIRKETPIIIETPCGNKNEMLNTPSKFSSFMDLYPEHLVGVCVDTCHVFVSGKMPLEYLEELRGDDLLRQNCFDRLCLIHFNGSRKKFGCCADGHAHVTTINNIPDEELEGVLMVAKKFNIPCVTE